MFFGFMVFCNRFRFPRPSLGPAAELRIFGGGGKFGGGFGFSAEASKSLGGGVFQIITRTSLPSNGKVVTM